MDYIEFKDRWKILQKDNATDTTKALCIWISRPTMCQYLPKTQLFCVIFQKTNIKNKSINETSIRQSKHPSTSLYVWFKIKKFKAVRHVEARRFLGYSDDKLRGFS